MTAGKWYRICGFGETSASIKKWNVPKADGLNPQGHQHYYNLKDSLATGNRGLPLGGEGYLFVKTQIINSSKNFN